MLGLSLNLPKGAVADIENRRQESLRNQQEREDDGASQENSDEEVEPNDEGANYEEDRELMPFVPETSDEESESDISNNDDESESDDNMSLGPPPSMPMIVVDVENLCGYKPEDEAEAKFLNDEISKALLGCETASLQEDGVDASKNRDNVIGDGLSLDFIKRCCELFESGSAIHSDTLAIENSVKDDFSKAVIPYPEFILYNEFNTVPGEHFESTAGLWKAVIYPHNIPTVQRVLELLANCSRDIIWKYEMSREIRRIAKEESRFKKEKFRRAEVDKWRKEKRPAELSKLYEVRETFVLKLDAARAKCETHKRDREVRVQRELQRRREKGIGTGGMASLDWDGKVTFAFEDDVDDILNSIMGKKDDYRSDSSCPYHDSFSDNENDADEESYGSSGDDKNISTELLQEPNEALSISIPPSNSTLMSDRKKRRAVSASKRMRRKMKNESEKLKMNELRAKIIAARDEEHSIQETMINNDERMSIAIVLSLEKRLEQVDNLLETLQEEEWQDEEECPSDVSEVSFENSNGIIDKPQELSLLDQILAMILGSQPVEEKNKQEHFKCLKLEHENIVQEWQGFFGRLPKAPFASGSKKENGGQAESNPCHSLNLSLNEGDAVSKASDLTSKNISSDLPKRVTEHWEDISDSDDETLPIKQDVEGSYSTTSNLKREDATSESLKGTIQHWEVISDSEVDLLHNVKDQTPPKAQNGQTGNQSSFHKPKVGLRPGGKVKTELCPL